VLVATVLLVTETDAVRVEGRPVPRVSLFYKGKGEIAKLLNRDFTAGHIYTNVEKIRGFRGVIRRANKELKQLETAINWHAISKNGTIQLLERAVKKFEEANLKYTLLRKHRKLLHGEVKNMERQVNYTINNTDISLPENLLKYEIVSHNSTGRARLRIAFTAAVQHAAMKASRAYDDLKTMLEALASQSGQSLDLNDAPVKGFVEHVAQLQERIKSLDESGSKLQVRAASDLRDALVARNKEKSQVEYVKSIRADLRAERHRLRHAEHAFNTTKSLYEQS